MLYPQQLQLVSQNTRQDTLKSTGPQNLSNSAHKIPSGQFVPQF